jgi:hypothetical protein
MTIRPGPSPPRASTASRFRSTARSSAGRRRHRRCCSTCAPLRGTEPAKITCSSRPRSATRRRSAGSRNPPPTSSRRGRRGAGRARERLDEHLEPFSAVVEGPDEASTVAAGEAEACRATPRPPESKETTAGPNAFGITRMRLGLPRHGRRSRAAGPSQIVVTRSAGAARSSSARVRR